MYVITDTKKYNWQTKQSTSLQTIRIILLIKKVCTYREKKLLEGIYIKREKLLEGIYCI